VRNYQAMRKPGYFVSSSWFEETRSLEEIALDHA
jgi:hypothetical protein